MERFSLEAVETQLFRVAIFKNFLRNSLFLGGRLCPHISKLVVKMAAEDATIEACNLFSQLAISKTTTIEEVVSKNYGSWRALLTLMKEIRQDDTSKFSKLDLERIANLSVGFHQWGTRQLKERSPMFSDEFKRFVSNRLIVESLIEDLMGSARSKGGDENNDENVDDGFGGEQSKTKTSGGAETKASLSPSVRKKQLKKAVMIEIPIDGECEIEEEEEEEEEAFKVSGKVMNTPPQQQQQQQQQQRQQQRVAEPHHTRFDSSPESEGGIFEEEEAAEEEEEEEEEEDILMETPAAPRQRRDGSMPPPLEAVTVMKPHRESVAMTPKQVYESAERLKRLASEKLQKFSVEGQRYGEKEDQEEGLSEDTTTMEEVRAAAYQEQVLNYLEGFEAILEKIKGQVAKIKNAPLSLAMAETISVELEIESSMKEIRAEIRAQNK